MASITIYETPTKKRRHLFSTRVVKQMANPRVRRTSGFHFLTTSVENTCPWMSGSFMLSHKVIHFREIQFNIKTKNKEKDRILGFKDASMAILIWRHDFYDVRKFVTSIENAHLHLFVNLLDQTHSFAIKLDNFTLLSYIYVNTVSYTHLTLPTT